MTVRSDIEEIVRGASGESSALICSAVLDYFQFPECERSTLHGRAVSGGVMLAVRCREEGWSADRISHRIVVFLHDIGIVEVRSGILDDDPEIVESLAAWAPPCGMGSRGDWPD